MPTRTSSGDYVARKQVSAYLHNLAQKKKAGPDAIEPFPPQLGLNTYKNSVNIVVAPQGNGKTTYATDEAATIAANDHLLGTKTIVFVVMRKAFDPAVEATADLLDSSALHGLGGSLRQYTWENFSEPFFDHLAAVRKYQELTRQAQEWKIRPEHIPEYIGGNPSALLQELGLHSFGPRVQTILILDDSGKNKLLRNEASALVNTLRICRELSLIVFILTHSFQDLTPSVKSNSTSVTLCGGLSDDRLQFIARQTNAGLSFRELSDLYRSALESGRFYLVINNKEGTIATA
jgi:hypothetical protein